MTANPKQTCCKYENRIGNRGHRLEFAHPTFSGDKEKINRTFLSFWRLFACCIAANQKSRFQIKGYTHYLMGRKKCGSVNRWKTHHRYRKEDTAWNWDFRSILPPFFPQKAHPVISWELFIFQRIFVLPKESHRVNTLHEMFSMLSYCANHRLCHITPSRRDKKPDLLELSANAGKLILKTSWREQKSRVPNREKGHAPVFAMLLAWPVPRLGWWDYSNPQVRQYPYFRHQGCLMSSGLILA